MTGDQTQLLGRTAQPEAPSKAPAQPPFPISMTWAGPGRSPEGLPHQLVFRTMEQAARAIREVGSISSHAFTKAVQTGSVVHGYKLERLSQEPLRSDIPMLSAGWDSSTTRPSTGMSRVKDQPEPERDLAAAKNHDVSHGIPDEHGRLCKPISMTWVGPGRSPPEGLPHQLNFRTMKQAARAIREVGTISSGAFLKAVQTGSVVHGYKLERLSQVPLSSDIPILSADWDSSTTRTTRMSMVKDQPEPERDLAAANNHGVSRGITASNGAPADCRTVGSSAADSQTSGSDDRTQRGGADAEETEWDALEIDGVDFVQFDELSALFSNQKPAVTGEGGELDGNSATWNNSRKLACAQTGAATYKKSAQNKRSSGQDNRTKAPERRSKAGTEQTAAKRRRVESKRTKKPACQVDAPSTDASSSEDGSSDDDQVDELDQAVVDALKEMLAKPERCTPASLAVFLQLTFGCTYTPSPDVAHAIALSYIDDPARTKLWVLSLEAAAERNAEAERRKEEVAQQRSLEMQELKFRREQVQNLAKLVDLALQSPTRDSVENAGSLVLRQLMAQYDAANRALQMNLDRLDAQIGSTSARKR